MNKEEIVKKNSVKIIIALIGLATTFVSGIFSGKVIKNNEINFEIKTEINGNSNVNITGDGNIVNINNLTDLLNAYNTNLNELNDLKEKYTVTEANITELQKQYIELSTNDRKKIEELENLLSLTE